MSISDQLLGLEDLPLARTKLQALRNLEKRLKKLSADFSGIDGNPSDEQIRAACVFSLAAFDDFTHEVPGWHDLGFGIRKLLIGLSEGEATDLPAWLKREKGRGRGSVSPAVLQLRASCAAVLNFLMDQTEMTRPEAAACVFRDMPRELKARALPRNATARTIEEWRDSLEGHAAPERAIEKNSYLKVGEALRGMGGEPKASAKKMLQLIERSSV